MSGNPAPLVILTRPAAQSRDYGRELRRLFGARIRIVKAPLLRIEPTARSVDLSGVGRLLFTSGNGVRVFCDLSARRDIPALCVGDRTADLARASGMTAISAAGGAGDLVKLAGFATAGPDAACLHVRGEHSTGDIIGALRRAGLDARAAIVYRQAACELSTAATDALVSENRVILPLFSPRTAKVMTARTTGMAIQRTTAVCISSNVARALGAHGFQDVKIAKRPDAGSVSDEIEDLI